MSWLDDLINQPTPLETDIEEGVGIPLLLAGLLGSASGMPVGAPVATVGGALSGLGYEGIRNRFARQQNASIAQILSRALNGGANAPLAALNGPQVLGFNSPQPLNVGAPVSSAQLLRQLVAHGATPEQALAETSVAQRLRTPPRPPSQSADERAIAAIMQRDPKLTYDQAAELYHQRSRAAPAGAFHTIYDKTGHVIGAMNWTTGKFVPAPGPVAGAYGSRPPAPKALTPAQAELNAVETRYHVGPEKASEILARRRAAATRKPPMLPPQKKSVGGVFYILTRGSDGGWYYARYDPHWWSNLVDSAPARLPLPPLPTGSRYYTKKDGTLGIAVAVPEPY